MVRRLETLLVDVGGTLVDDATWLRRRQYEELMLDRLRGAFGDEHPWFRPLITQHFPDSGAPRWEQRTIDVVIDFLAEQGIGADREVVERICRTFAIPLGQVVRLAPGALDAVRAVHRLGVRMVICSNTLWRNDADLERDWEELGFGGLFDAYVSSHDAGYGKPHPAIFERALEKTGSAPDEAAIIGDRPERDLAGARAVGMRAIWFRPPGETDADPPADAAVDRWSEVPAIIRSWRY